MSYLDVMTPNKSEHLGKSVKPDQHLGCIRCMNMSENLTFC